MPQIDPYKVWKSQEKKKVTGLSSRAGENMEKKQEELVKSIKIFYDIERKESTVPHDVRGAVAAKK